MEVLYLDNKIIVCVKPAGVLSTDEPGGMPSLLRAALGDDTAPVYTVHRLDAAVSGVMVYARTRHAAADLGRAIERGDVRKEYLAVACGTGLPPRGTIDLPIARADDGSTRRIPAPGGQPSVTDYTVLAERDGCTLLRVAPRTGRTHQIRVHFAALGHPLLGDALYGGEMSRLTRPALHSAAADFAQPVTGQSLHITAPIPRDLRAFDFERYL